MMMTFTLSTVSSLYINWHSFKDSLSVRWSAQSLALLLEKSNIFISLLISPFSSFVPNWSNISSGCIENALHEAKILHLTNIFSTLFIFYCKKLIFLKQKYYNLFTSVIYLFVWLFKSFVRKHYIFEGRDTSTALLLLTKICKNQRAFWIFYVLKIFSSGSVFYLMFSFYPKLNKWCYSFHWIQFKKPF